MGPADMGNRVVEMERRPLPCNLSRPVEPRSLQGEPECELLLLCSDLLAFAETTLRSPGCEAGPLFRALARAEKRRRRAAMAAP